MKLTAFCLFYIIAFFALLGLTPLGSFPPPPLTFTMPAITIGGVPVSPEVTYTVPWTRLMAFVVVRMVAIVIAVNARNVKVMGSGLNVDARQLSKVIVGCTMSGLLGTTMTAMMPSDVPAIVTMFLVWPWVALLAYSIIVEA